MARSNSPSFIAALLITGLTATASLSVQPAHAGGLQSIQYGPQGSPPYGYDDRNQDRGQYGQDRGQYGYEDRDYRGGRKWRPGEIIPPQLLRREVVDWEERGLSRPPGGHRWMRVGLQFVLVRDSDRKIARILNFD